MGYLWSALFYPNGTILKTWILTPSFVPFVDCLAFGSKPFCCWMIARQYAAMAHSPWDNALIVQQLLWPTMYLHHLRRRDECESKRKILLWKRMATPPRRGIKGGSIHSSAVRFPHLSCRIKQWPRNESGNAHIFGNPTACHSLGESDQIKIGGFGKENHSFLWHTKNWKVWIGTSENIPQKIKVTSNVVWWEIASLVHN